MYATNHVPKQDIAGSPTGCCPVFEPQKWDGQTFHFKNKLFMKVGTVSFLHIPLNIGSVFRKAAAAIAAAEAGAGDEYLTLSEDVSPWHADHYLAVTKEVPNADMVHLSGQYYAEVFEGPYSQGAKWHRELIATVTDQGLTPERIFFFHTTCPRCAKVYGKNYAVGFAKVG